ncbi:MAG: YqiA/YcfP family alpha/beta fold hydrolase [Cyanophyceae cyanobacterium]
MVQPAYIYLHGFASGPRSTKAQYLRDRFWQRHIDLQILDLNQEDFSHLTLTRQLQQAAAAFPASTPITLIGSSFGGLTAAWLGQQHQQVQRLVLLAPAFSFLEYWLPQLGGRLQQWQETGYLSIYHYGEGRCLPLHYQFVPDIQQYPELQLQRPVPTLILHGRSDEVIPVQASRDYASQRPWVELIELKSDHTLTSTLPTIWQQIQSFCL